MCAATGYAAYFQLGLAGFLCGHRRLCALRSRMDSNRNGLHSSTCVRWCGQRSWHCGLLVLWWRPSFQLGSLQSLWQTKEHEYFQILSRNFAAGINSSNRPIVAQMALVCLRLQKLLLQVGETCTWLDMLSLGSCRSPASFLDWQPKSAAIQAQYSRRCHNLT